jgi:hypothetical protein
MTTIDNILTYHLQKLQEVGYMRMQPVNITDVTLNLRNPETNEIMTTEQGRIVEMTYSTSSAPDEMRRGYFIITATDATAPNPETTKGYSIFYEGNSTSTNSAAEITTAAASLPPPPSIAEVFDSFELIAAAEAAEDGDDDDDDDDNGGDDNGDNGGNGGDDNDDNDDNGDNGGDDNGDNGEGDEGEGGDGGEGNPNEFDNCIVPPGMDPGDVGC